MSHASSVSHQLLVSYAVGLVCSNTEAASTVFFVLREVPVEPDRLALSFKCKDVRRDAIQKPPVVSDYNGTPGKTQQGLLKCPECIHIKIVCRFIEQQNVGPFPENLCKMHTIPFTAGKHARFLLLVRSTEIESGDIGTRVHIPIAKPDHFLSA